MNDNFELVNSFNYQKADKKIFVCKFSKKCLSPSYIILRIQRLDGKLCRSRQSEVAHFEPPHQDLLSLQI